MNLTDGIVLFLLLSLTAGILWSMRRSRRRSGCSGCNGCTSSCGRCPGKTDKTSIG